MVVVQMLLSNFDRFGPLQIRVMKNRDTGESKGFAFVAFKTKDVAQKAIEVLHNKEFKVTFAESI